MTITPAGSPEVVKKTWMPKIAGILNIANGTVELIGGLTIIGAVELLPIFKFNDSWLADYFGFPLIIAGIVAIIGGVCSFRRRRWGVALAGAICSLFLFQWTLTGIFAIISLASSKKEFN